MRDLREGEDYLVDWYAVLGVERAASSEEIKEAYKKKIQQWHPDRLHGLAPSLVAQAENQSALLNKARNIVGDPAFRATYDEKLGSWKGAISKDGVPIIDLSAGGFSMGSLMEALSLLPEEADLDAKTTALQYSSFDEGTYELIAEQMRAAKDPSPALKKAYLAQVESRNLFLTLYEELLLSNLGVSINPESSTMIEHLSHTEEELAGIKAKAATSLEKEAVLLMTGERSLLPPPSGGGSSQAVGEVFAEYSERIGRHIEVFEKKIKALAAERQPLIEELFKAADVTYHPATVRYTGKVIVKLKKEGAPEKRMLFNVTKTSVRGDIAPSGTDEELIETGHTVLSFTPVPDIEFKSQLFRILHMHLERMEKENESAPA